MRKLLTRSPYPTPRRTRDPRSRQEGFTLVEMLLVVVVLGILAAVVVMNLGGVATSASVSACEANVATVQSAVSAYNVESGGATPATAALLTSGATPYLTSFPTSADYAITLVNGQVMVAAPASGTSVAATSAGACAGAGATSASQASAQSTTTTSTTTTTAPASNGVVITASSSSSGNVYYGTDSLRFSDAASTTNITITVVVDQATGITADSAYNTFGGFSNVAITTANGKITYVYRGSISQYASSGLAVFTYGGNGNTHNPSLDTWSVTSTHNGVTATQSGHF